MTLGLLPFVKHHRQEAAPPEVEVPLGLNEHSMHRIARLGSGFIVWERCKADSWQIWTKRLEGGREERLVPAEEGKDHFCPKISPDGKLLAYLSYEKGTNAYPAFRGKMGTLHLMELKTRESEILVSQVRSYAEDRAVTWRNAQTLCFINASGETMEMDLKTRKSHKVLQEQSEDFGYLPSPDLKHATSGTPEFAMVTSEGVIKHQKNSEGCQPYFTSDSRWGFWMAGAGGPLKAMNLETGEEKTMLERDDPRLPERRNYLYFPMVSPCMRLLAFAASPDKHNHFEADYDIYVALLNPRTMEVLGHPVRYTKFSGCDRFPDVFRNELALGTHFVEGETTVNFVPPKYSGVFDFTFDDGGQAHGARAGHTFKKPGDYWIKAVSIHPDVKNLRGFVHVDPPAAPEVVEISREGDDLLIEFNEELEAQRATGSFSGGKVLTPELVETNRALRFHLSPELFATESFTLEGVTDRAQHPNAFPKQALKMPHTEWPVSSQGLQFAWSHAKAGLRLPGGIECRLAPHEVAFWNADQVMQLRGGWFEARDAGPRISAACQKADAFTVEALITPQPLGRVREYQPIVTLGDSSKDANLIIAQKEYAICFGLRRKGQEIAWHEVSNVTPNTEHHLMVTSEKEGVTVYLDGKPKEVSPAVKITTLADWKPQGLHFGSHGEGTPSWRGLIERVAFYSRAFSREEAMEAAKNAQTMLDARAQPGEWTVLAKLVESSPPPSLEEIQPYQEALVRQLYEVKEVLGGPGPVPKEIVVNQWVWLGGHAMPAQSLKNGDTVKLTLHEIEAHHELRALFTKDSLSGGFDAKQYYDASEWDEPLEKH